MVATYCFHDSSLNLNHFDLIQFVSFKLITIFSQIIFPPKFFLIILIIIIVQLKVATIIILGSNFHLYLRAFLLHFNII